MQGDKATNQYFAPLATYAERFGEMLDDVARLGFTHLDIWTAHCHADWASEEHLAVAKRELDARGLTVVSMAGGFGATPEDVRRHCRVAKALGTDLLGGGSSLLTTDRVALVNTLEEMDCRLGFENHPSERSVADIEAVIGTGDESRIGVCFDTGWSGTNGFDAAEAIQGLAGRLFHVHLKDVQEAGQHRTCALGEGVVGIDRCLHALSKIDYSAVIGIEHEPEDRDPMPEIEQSVDYYKANWPA